MDLPLCHPWVKEYIYPHWPVAHLVGASSRPPKVAGLIPHQGTYLGCSFNPRSESRIGGNRLMFLSHTSVWLSLSKINKHPQARIKKKECIYPTIPVDGVLLPLMTTAELYSVLSQSISIQREREFLVVLKMWATVHREEWLAYCRGRRPPALFHED